MHAQQIVIKYLLSNIDTTWDQLPSRSRVDGQDHFLSTWDASDNLASDGTNNVK